MMKDIINITILPMGNACNNDGNVNGAGFGNQSSGNSGLIDDSTMVMPDFNDMRSLISKKVSDLDLDVTRSTRGVNSSDVSLILPAAKNIPPNLIIRYFLIYSFYIEKYR